MQGRSYIVQLDFSAAFDRVSHSGLLFKLKSIGVGGRVLFICTEFLSDRGQRVVADDAACERIPIISGVLPACVLGFLLFNIILYSSEMFEQVENRLFACADDSTLLAVVRKPTDRPADANRQNILFACADDSTLLAVVRKPTDRPADAAALNRDLARIQEWSNHWWMILNPNKTKTLVVSRSRTVRTVWGPYPSLRL